MDIKHYTNPFSILELMQDELNKALSRPVKGADDTSSAVTSMWSPNVDIKEEADKYVVMADLPGVDPKDIEVTMHDNILTIKGQRHDTKTTKDEQHRLVKRERFYGTFCRRFTLPDSVDENISASSKNGVLTLTLPKMEKSKPRVIQVKTEDNNK